MLCSPALLDQTSQQSFAVPDKPATCSSGLDMSTDRAAEVDGRLRSSICTEQAAHLAGRCKVGLWSIIDGTPYQSLGQIASIAMEMPHLHKHDADAAIAAR